MIQSKFEIDTLNSQLAPWIGIILELHTRLNLHCIYLHRNQVNKVNKINKIIEKFSN